MNVVSYRESQSKTMRLAWQSSADVDLDDLIDAVPSGSSSAAPLPSLDVK